MVLVEATRINGRSDRSKGNIVVGFGVITARFRHDGYGRFGNDEFELGGAY